MGSVINRPDTEFLRKIGQSLRKKQPRFTPPKSYFQQRGPEFAEIWFPSVGCSWYFHGYCTTCNYGHSAKVSPESMVAAVREGVKNILPSTEILWVSSFNVFDEKEVPSEVLEDILKVISSTPAKCIISETHPDTVSQHNIRKCVDALPDKKFIIELGVETLDPFIRKWCVNKDFSNDSLRRTVDLIHREGALCYANIMIGLPFLTEKEALNEAISSCKRAIDFGFDKVILFPCHVKPFTLVEWLYNNDKFVPPSIWSVVELLRSLSNEELDKVNIAWLEPKLHPGAANVSSPGATDLDKSFLIENLNEWEDYNSEQALQKILNYTPDSWYEWKNNIESEVSLETLLERLNSSYETLGKEILGNQWWENNGKEVIEAVISSMAEG